MLCLEKEFRPSIKALPLIKEKRNVIHFVMRIKHINRTSPHRELTLLFLIQTQMVDASFDSRENFSENEG